MEFERQGLVGEFDFFWVFDVEPFDYFEYQTTKRMYFILKNDDTYSTTCPRLGATVDYDKQQVDIFALEPDQHPESGDGLLSVKLDDAKWQEVVERIGTFEQNKAIVTQRKAAAAVESRKNRVPKVVEGIIQSFLGGRRKTRKSKKNRKQTRRRKN